MTNIQKIITAGGDSRKLFMGAGFDAPKSLVRIGGKSILERALSSYLAPGDSATVAINQGEAKEYPIAETVRAFGGQTRIVEVSSSVRGALATALVAAVDLELDAPLVIAAGDSEIAGGLGVHLNKFIESDCHSGTVAFASNNPRWSYLSVGEGGKVLEVAEKEVVGPLATTGVFYFKTASLFLQAAEWALLNRASVNNRYYVSTSLNYLISLGLDVGYSVIERNDYAAYSLPADLVRQEP
jgi:NDP-sugar pyrophosphorylase family protein